MLQVEITEVKFLIILILIILRNPVELQRCGNPSALSTPVKELDDRAERIYIPLIERKRFDTNSA